MDDNQLKKELEKKGFKDVDSFLAHEKVKYTKWSESRRTVAAKQLVAQQAGFDPGEIDGLAGPQTAIAFERYNGEEYDRAAIEKANKPKQPGPVLKTVFPYERDVMKFYGAIGKNQIKVTVPYDMYLAWNKAERVKTISVHQKCADSLKRVLKQVPEIYSAKEIKDLGLDMFGGCFNPRMKRGGTTWSMHAWAIALDFDPERNQLKWGAPRARLSHQDAEGFWRLWETEGWCSLGRQSNFDWMHVQAARCK